MSARKHMGASRTIKIKESTYRTMRSLKQRTEKRTGEKMTYSDHIDELNKIAELLLDGQETYVVNGELFTDNAEAWGAAMLASAKGQPTKPDVYLYLGQDNSFELGSE